MSRFLKALYNAFPPAMLIAVGLFRITWLEMRVNIGWIFFGLWALFTLILVVWSRFFGKLLSVGGTSANLLVCCAGCAALLGLKRLAVVPASLIREGLTMTRLPFSTVNAVVIAALLLGWIALFLRKR
jgi:hypothetical protein